MRERPISTSAVPDAEGADLGGRADCRGETARETGMAYGSSPMPSEGRGELWWLILPWLGSPNIRKIGQSLTLILLTNGGRLEAEWRLEAECLSKRSASARVERHRKCLDECRNHSAQRVEVMLSRPGKQLPQFSSLPTSGEYRVLSLPEARNVLNVTRGSRAGGRCRGVAMMDPPCAESCGWQC